MVSTAGWYQYVGLPTQSQSQSDSRYVATRTDVASRQSGCWLLAVYWRQYIIGDTITNRNHGKVEAAPTKEQGKWRKRKPGKAARKVVKSTLATSNPESHTYVNRE